MSWYFGRFIFKGLSLIIAGAEPDVKMDVKMACAHSYQYTRNSHNPGSPRKMVSFKYRA